MGFGLVCVRSEDVTPAVLVVRDHLLLVCKDTTVTVEDVSEAGP
jgi:hypothetical protein